jgi:8-oxo-dGTP pyrophosphatase MutT (NUDIX family)
MGDKPPYGFVECVTVHGKKKLVPRGDLHFRPGAYGFIFRENKMLFVKMRLNGKYCLPGGGVDLGEPALDALRREVKEETGLDVTAGRFVGVWENLHYYDPQDKAWHGYAFCWECEPTTAGLALDPDAGDEDEGNPEWVDLATLTPDDCHGITWRAVCEYLDRAGKRDRSFVAIEDYLEVSQRSGF